MTGMQRADSNAPKALAADPGRWRGVSADFLNAVALKGFLSVAQDSVIVFVEHRGALGDTRNIDVTADVEGKALAALSAFENKAAVGIHAIRFPHLSNFDLVCAIWTPADDRGAI